MLTALHLFVNGRAETVSGDDAFLTLSEFLRQRRALVGTKVVCAEGDCGACTVLVGRPDGERLRYEAVDSCIVFLYQLHGTHVVTVEGLRTSGGPLTEVQEAMVHHFGSQCGYCTPGIVVALTALLEQEQPLDDATVRYGLSGNLCRCTGYLQIIEAAAAVDSDTAPRLAELYPEPAILAELARYRGRDVRIEAGGRTCFVPADLDAALELKSEQPQATVVAGATDVGVQVNKRRLAPEAILSLGQHLPGFGDVEVDGGSLVAGGGATWSRIEAAVRQAIPQLHAILRVFGAPQIRNLATIGGNLANGSPIADSLPFLFVMEAEIELRSAGGKRRVPVTELYRGYKETCLRPDELITRVVTPLPAADEVLKLYKMSKRRDLDISTLTAGFLLRLDGERIAAARIAYGGVAPVVMRLPRTEQLLAGRRLDESSLRQAGRRARDEIAPISDVRGSADFRRQLSENLLLKLYHDVRPAAAA